MSYAYLFKLIIIGDQGVGKSNMLKRFVQSTFNQKHVTTIGVEFGAKILKIRGLNIKLQIWDTAGQQAFISITRGYFRSAAGAIIMYDVGNIQSFQSLKKWLSQARQHSIQNMSYILVGNKTDLLNRKVSTQQAKLFAQRENMPYIEVSAKNGDKVIQCFNKLATMVFQKMTEGKLDLTGQNGIRTGPQYVRTQATQSTLGIKLDKETSKQKSRCSC